MPIFFGHARFNAMRAAEITRHKLMPIADTEDWHLQLVDFRVHRGARWFGDARRASRDDDAARTAEIASRVTNVRDDGMHPELADGTGDEMAILPARVEDDDLIQGRRGPTGDAPASAPAGRPCLRS